MKIDFTEYLPSTRLFRRIAREREPFSVMLPRALTLPRRGEELAVDKEDVPNLAHRKTGTTVLGMRFFDDKVEENNFAVLAGDRRVTWGWYILSHDTIKTTPISSHSAVAAAGTSGIIELIERQLKRELRIFEDEYEMEPPVPSHAKLLQAIIQQYLSLFIFAWDLASIFIFTGYDNRPYIPFSRRPFLIWFDDIGGSSASEPYLPHIALGSGMYRAQTVLDDEEHGWRPNMTRQEAVTLAVRAIWASGKRDPGTESVTENVPTVFVIDGRGITVVPEDTIYGIVLSIMQRRTQAIKRRGGRQR